MGFVRRSPSAPVSGYCLTSSRRQGLGVAGPGRAASQGLGRRACYGRKDGTAGPAATGRASGPRSRGRRRLASSRPKGRMNRLCRAAIGANRQEGAKLGTRARPVVLGLLAGLRRSAASATSGRESRRSA